jgi:hypothetical protein
MGRITAASVLGTFLVILTAAPGVSFARQDADDSATPRAGRAYKPAQWREQEEQATQAARREAAAPAKDDTAVPANVTDPEAYKKELDAAKEQRDRDLKDAAKETDRRKFQKRQEEIFAQYAAILSAMRDKYDASKTGDGTQTPQRPGKSGKAVAARNGASDRYATPERAGRPETRKRAAKSYDETVLPEAESPTPKGKKSTRPGRKGDDDAGGLDEAQKRLDDENSRHDSLMEQLNKELSDAQGSKNKREIRKAERAIEKENTAYEAKKSMLESRVKELGGKIDAPAPAPAPARRAAK